MIRTATTPARAALTVAGALVLLAGCEQPVPESDVLAVSAAYADRVYFLDPSTGDVVTELETDPRRDVRDGPAGLLPAGPDRWLLLFQEPQPALWVMPRTGRTPLETIAMPDMRSAGRVVLSPDGERAYVSEYHLGDVNTSGQVAVVDLASGSVQHLVSCLTPYGLSLSPDGSRLAVSCPLADAIAVYDTNTLERITQFNITPPDMRPGVPGNPVLQPLGIAWSPGGDRLWVSLLKTGEVASYTPDGVFIRRAAVGEAPMNLVVTDLGRRIVVADRQGGGIAVMDTRSFESREIALPEALHPHDLILSPDGEIAYVVWEGGPEQDGGVSAVELESGEVLWNRATGPFSLGITLLPAATEGAADDEG